MIFEVIFLFTVCLVVVYRDELFFFVGVFMNCVVGVMIGKQEHF